MELKNILFLFLVMCISFGTIFGHQNETLNQNQIIQGEKNKMILFFENYIFPNLHYYMGIIIALFIWFSKLGNSKLNFKDSFELKTSLMIRFLFLLTLSLISFLFLFLIMIKLNFYILVFSFILALLSFLINYGDYFNDDSKDVIKTFSTIFSAILIGRILYYLDLFLLRQEYFLLVVLYSYMVYILYFFIFILAFLIISSGDLSGKYIFKIKLNKLRKELTNVQIIKETNESISFRNGKKIHFVKKEDIEYIERVDLENEDEEFSSN